MEHLLGFFEFIGQSQGFPIMWVVIVFVIIIGLIVLFIKTFPDTIQQYLEQKTQENKSKHIDGISKRKKFSKDVKTVLRDLAEEVGADRALLFEYTNGTSNLIGLPFVYASAASEVLAPGVSSVSHLYQKINISIAADFLIHLEEDGYLFIDDLELLKMHYPVIYNFMKPSGVSSALFYPIQGVEEVLGFIVVTTVGGHKLNKKEAIQKVSLSAQQISSMMNFEELDKKMNRNKKWLW